MSQLCQGVRKLLLVVIEQGRVWHDDKGFP